MKGIWCVIEDLLVHASLLVFVHHEQSSKDKGNTEIQNDLTSGITICSAGVAMAQECLDLTIFVICVICQK